MRNTNPNSASFSNVLTADQIAQLPDDPEEFENAINQLAGPGSQIRVNGFRGGNFRRNHRSARFVFVSIRTRRKTTTPASDSST